MPSAPMQLGAIFPNVHAVADLSVMGSLVPISMNVPLIAMTVPSMRLASTLRVVSTVRNAKTKTDLDSPYPDKLALTAPTLVTIWPPVFPTTISKAMTVFATRASTVMEVVWDQAHQVVTISTNV